METTITLNEQQMNLIQEILYEIIEGEENPRISPYSNTTKAVANQILDKLLEAQK